MDAGEPPLPSPEALAELARRGEAIRREAERLVEDAFRAIDGDPALGAAAADVAAFLARRAREAGPGPAKVMDGDEQENTG